MFRIFIIEDDRSLAELLRERLESYDYQVICADFQESILQTFIDTDPHLVLLDVNLPKSDGFHICRQIREVSKVPVLFISARNSSMDTIMGLSSGADDYLTKPFDFEVLLAKIDALLRRTYSFNTEGSSDLLEHRGLILDSGASRFRYKDHRFELTKNELRILFTLMKNSGTIVSRDHLMEALWQQDTFVDDNTLTVNVNRLRKKLNDAGISGFIETKKQQGYIIK